MSLQKCSFTFYHANKVVHTHKLFIKSVMLLTLLQKLKDKTRGWPKFVKCGGYVGNFNDLVYEFRGPRGTEPFISLSFFFYPTIDLFVRFFLFIAQFNPLLFDIIFSYREKFILFNNNKVVKNTCLLFLTFAINTVILNNDIINIFRATKISGKKMSC